MSPQEERTVRDLLWISHAIPGDGRCLYGDDGELQCSGIDGACDFARDPIARIVEHIERRGWRLLARQKPLPNCMR